MVEGFVENSLSNHARSSEYDGFDFHRSFLHVLERQRSILLLQNSQLFIFFPVLVVENSVPVPQVNLFSLDEFHLDICFNLKRIAVCYDEGGVLSDFQRTGLRVDAENFGSVNRNRLQCFFFWNPVCGCHRRMVRSVPFGHRFPFTGDRELNSRGEQFRRNGECSIVRFPPAAWLVKRWADYNGNIVRFQEISNAPRISSADDHKLNVLIFCPLNGCFNLSYFIRVDKNRNFLFEDWNHRLPS